MTYYVYGSRLGDPDMEGTMKNKFIVRCSAAKMPSSCWGKYRRVAVLEVEPGVERVSMISTRARGVVRVVATWEDLNVGTTERCAYAKAMRAAQSMADELNQK